MTQYKTQVQNHEKTLNGFLFVFPKWMKEQFSKQQWDPWHSEAIATHAHYMLSFQPLKFPLPLDCYFHFAFEDITAGLATVFFYAILLRQFLPFSGARAGRGKEKGKDRVMRYGEQGAEEKKRGRWHVLTYVIAAQHHLTIRLLKQEPQKLCPKEMKANMLSGSPTWW